MDLNKARGAFLRVIKTLLFIESREDSELFNRTLMVNIKDCYFFSIKIWILNLFY